MITVHHLENSRSQRVLWLLEELGLDYEIQFYKRDPETSLAPPELRKVHPLGKSPVITDGDLVVAETGAIIDYIMDRYADGRLMPTDDADRLNYRYWMHAAEGTVAPLLVMTLVFNRVESAPMPFFARPIAKNIAAKVRSAYIAPSLDAVLAHRGRVLSSEIDQQQRSRGCGDHRALHSVPARRASDLVPVMVVASRSTVSTSPPSMPTACAASASRSG